MPHAITFTEFGPPEVLHLTEVPEKTAGPGQLRVAVRAAGVNPYDWKVRTGSFQGAGEPEFPKWPGQEYAGVVDQVGEGVEGFAVGDEVLGRAPGSYAEQVLADPARAGHRPASLSWESAAGLAVAVDAAYRVLIPLGLEPGQTLLVDAAAGGVGGVLVQVAVARGLTVIGTASERNHDRLRELGAIPTVYGDGLADRVAALAPGGVDAAADLAGKGSLATLVELVGDPAKVVTIADGAGASRLGVRFTGGPDPSIPGSLDDALRLVAEGRLDIPVGHVYPLAEAAAAQRESETGRSEGRIVLRVG